MRVGRSLSLRATRRARDTSQHQCIKGRGWRLRGSWDIFPLSHSLTLRAPLSYRSAFLSPLAPATSRAAHQKPNARISASLCGWYSLCKKSGIPRERDSLYSIILFFFFFFLRKLNWAEKFLCWDFFFFFKRLKKLFLKSFFDDVVQHQFSSNICNMRFIHHCGGPPHVFRARKTFTLMVFI